MNCVRLKENRASSSLIQIHPFGKHSPGLFERNIRLIGGGISVSKEVWNSKDGVLILKQAIEENNFQKLKTSLNMIKHTGCPSDCMIELTNLLAQELPFHIKEKLAKVISKLLARRNFSSQQSDLEYLKSNFENLKVPKNTLGGPELEFYIEKSLILLEGDSKKISKTKYENSNELLDEKEDFARNLWTFKLKRQIKAQLNDVNLCHTLLGSCKHKTTGNIALRVCYILAEKQETFKHELDHFLEENEDYFLESSNLLTIGLITKRRHIQEYLTKFEYLDKEMTGVRRNLYDSFLTGQIKLNAKISKSINSEKYPLFEKVYEFINSDFKRLLVILGEQGSGKTTFCKQLAKELLRENHDYLPLYVYLPDLVISSNSSFTESLSTNLLGTVMKYHTIDMNNQILNHRKYLLIIDGAQEMEDKTNLVKFRYPRTKIIVTGKDSLKYFVPYKDNIPCIQERTVLYIDYLSEDQIQSYIKENREIFNEIFRPREMKFSIKLLKIALKVLKKLNVSAKISKYKILKEYSLINPNSKMLMDFYLARDIIEALKTNTNIEILNQTIKFKKNNVIQLLKEKIKDEYLVFLKNIIKQSKNNPNLAKASSNAITILNKLRYDFIGEDLSRVKIQDSDLSTCNLKQVNLIGSDMRKTNLSNSIITYKGLINTNLLKAKFANWKILYKQHKPIMKVSVSNEFIVFSTSDNFNIYEISSGAVERSDSYTKYISDISISPHSKLIAIAFRDTIDIYKIHSKQTIVFKHQYNNFSLVEFSPDSKYLASADREVLIWKIKKREVIKVLDIGVSIQSLSYSPGGESIAFAHSGKFLSIWPLQSESPLLLKGHSDKVQAVAHSYDGVFIASASKDKTVRIWKNNVKYKEIAIYAKTICFSRDSQYLITAHKSIKVYEMGTWNFFTLTGHSRSITSVKTTLDGKYIVSVSKDGAVSLRNIESSYKGDHSDFVSSLAFTSDGKYCVSGSYDRTIKVWDIYSGKCRTLAGHNSYISSVAVSPSDAYIASGSYDRSIILWEFRTGNVVYIFSGLKNNVTSCVFSTNEEYIISGNKDGGIYIWNVIARSLHVKLNLYTDIVSAVDVSSNGLYFASAGENMVVVWEMKNFTSLIRMRSHYDLVKSVVFSKNSSYIASAGYDQRIIVRETKTFQVVYDFKAHAKFINSLHFSEDERFLASASNDKTIKVWKIENRQLKMVLYAHTDFVTSVRYSSNHVLASGSRDNTIKFWDRSVE